jgi:hypothetical protein
MILLTRSYGGYATGTIVQFQTAVEKSLVAQGFGTSSTGPVTPGAVTTSQVAGRVGIAAGANSVVVTNASLTTESKFVAYLSNAAADATATAVALITPGAGSVTFTTNANATAAVSIDWCQVEQSGLVQTS